MSSFVDDFAGADAALKQARRHVERDDLIGRLQERERNDFAHRIADERFGGRRHGFEMLDVERADDADAVLFERQRVLPALRVRGLAEIIVCQLVENHDVGLFAQRGFVIEIFEDALADVDVARRNARQTLRRCARDRGAPSFRSNRCDALAVGVQPSRVFEQPARLTRTGRARDVNDEPRAPARVRAAALRLSPCGPSRASLLRVGQGAPAERTERREHVAVALLRRCSSPLGSSICSRRSSSSRRFCSTVRSR